MGDAFYPIGHIVIIELDNSPWPTENRDKFNGRSGKVVGHDTENSELVHIVMFDNGDRVNAYTDEIKDRMR